VSFEKERFYLHSLFDLIHLHLDTIASRSSQLPINRGAQRQTLRTDFLVEHMWLIQKLI
jgi:hypothetical protein